MQNLVKLLRNKFFKKTKVEPLTKQDVHKAAEEPKKLDVQSTDFQK